jgi:thiol-disulfide isomerase/thioredoxin
MSRREERSSTGAAPTRRALVLAAPALFALGRANAQDASPWPPAFETERSQFTVVRPRAAMPPLKLQDLHGKDIVLQAKPGRVLLLNFWATWCAACRLDLPMLSRLQKARMEGIDIGAICTDTRDTHKIRTYLGSVGAADVSCYVGGDGGSAEARDAFQLMGMPITYLIGRSNLIEGYITGAADWLSPPGVQLLQFYRAQS